MRTPSRLLGQMHQREERLRARRGVQRVGDARGQSSRSRAPSGAGRARSPGRRTPRRGDGGRRRSPTACPSRCRRLIGRARQPVDSRPAIARRIVVLPRPTARRSRGPRRARRRSRRRAAIGPDWRSLTDRRRSATPPTHPPRQRRRHHERGDETTRSVAAMTPALRSSNACMRS